MFHYSIHADGWTETLAGVLHIISQIETLEKTGDTVNKIYLTRLVIISSSYLAEQVFAKAIRKYVDEALHCSSEDLFTNLLKDWDSRNSIKKIGITRALEEWPKVLTGKPLDFGVEPLQSLKTLMEKRNDIIHTLSDLTSYEEASTIGRSALHTALEASKTIDAHFFPGREFSYKGWLDAYSIPTGNYFSKVKILK
jgi:hypothetical protein